MSPPKQQQASDEDRLFEDMAKRPQPMEPDLPGIEQLPQDPDFNLDDYYTPEELADEKRWQFDPDLLTRNYG